MMRPGAQPAFMPESACVDRHAGGAMAPHANSGIGPPRACSHHFTYAPLGSRVETRRDVGGDAKCPEEHRPTGSSGTAYHLHCRAHLERLVGRADE